jgi:DNA-binding transcriptional MocR family regulator
LLEIQKDVNSKILKQAFKENGFSIPFLEDFYYEEIPNPRNPTLVINYSGIKKEKISDSVKALEKVLLEI